MCILSCFSRLELFVTLWTVACQAPLSKGFSRQEFWSGLPCLPLGSSSPRDQRHISCIAGGRRKWWPTLVFLPGEFCGERNRVGYSPWSCKESDITEGLKLSLSLPLNHQGNPKMRVVFISLHFNIFVFFHFFK